MTITNDSDIYYDPFDIEIDKDPHPLWKRMRDEAPLYRNEKYDFFALSRYDDVEKALVDWDTYRSGKGSTLETIMAGVEIPPGLILMEDPPVHDVHRGLMSRVFTPKAMLAIEPKVREFCARTLDPLVADRPLRLHHRPRRGHADADHRHAARHPRGGPGRDPRPDRPGPAPRRERRHRGAVGRSRLRGHRAVRRLHRLARRAPLRRPDDQAPPAPSSRTRPAPPARSRATRCSPT